MSEQIINTVLQYLPYALVVIEFIMIALGNKANLINGLGMLKEKCEELQEAAEMKELKTEIKTVVETNKALLNRISDLTSDIMRLEREVRNKDEQ